MKREKKDFPYSAIDFGEIKKKNEKSDRGTENSVIDIYFNIKTLI